MRLERNMYPTSFVDELCVRQVVSDVREPAWVHRYVNSAAFGMIRICCTAYGLVEGLTSEARVDVYRLMEVVSEGLQHLLAEPD